jgi:DNA-binding HxlR family transcriptional regulator
MGHTKPASPDRGSLNGSLRTSELRRSIPEITERMLIRHMHEMAEDGILLRHDKKSVPPHVCYSISPYGMTLAPVLEKICEWGRKHEARLKRNTKGVVRNLRNSQPRLLETGLFGNATL